MKQKPFEIHRIILSRLQMKRVGDYRHRLMDGKVAIDYFIRQMRFVDELTSRRHRDIYY